MKGNIRNKIHFAACAVLFFFANYRYGFLNALGIEIPEIVDKAVMGAIVVSMLAALASTDFRKIRSAWLRALILIVPAAIITVFSGEKSIVLSAVGILCLSDIDIKEIVLTDMICKAVIVLQAIVLSLTGVLANNVYEESIFGLKYKTFSFGFANANSPALLVMFILIEFVFLYNIWVSENGERIRHRHLWRNLAVGLVGLLTTAATGNKTLLIVVLLMILLSMSRKALKLMSNPFLTTIVCIVIVTVAVYYNGYGLSVAADKLFLNGRIFQAYSFFQMYPVKLFGAPIQMMGLYFLGSPVTLDCFYPRMLLDFGIIYYLVYLFGMFMLLAKAAGRKDSRSNNAALVIAVVTFAGIMESCYHILWMNPAMLFLPELIFGDFSIKDAWKSTREWYIAFAGWIKNKARYIKDKSKEGIPGGERAWYLDYLKVFALFAVIILHIAANAWTAVDVTGTEWQFYNMFDGMVRWCIPVFVMVGGALILNREMSFKELFAKRLLRLVCVYIFWNVLYYLVQGSGSAPHLWVIPVLAGLYILAPIIKPIVEKRQVLKYFIIIAVLLTSLMPTVLSLIKDFAPNDVAEAAQGVYEAVTYSLGMNTGVGYILYFVLGYALNKTELSGKQRKAIYIAGALGFIATVGLSSYLSVSAGQPCETYYDYFKLNVLLESTAVFTFVKYHHPRRDSVNMFTAYLSKLCFGMYIVHFAVIRMFSDMGLLSTPLIAIVSVPLVSLLIFIISFIYSAILNLVPVVKKYLV